jgi:hypothetical protein
MTEVDAMSPDLHFALILIVKMAVTAAFVVSATITAERAGPLVGGLVATLPLGAGPAYVFLAMDHDTAFIAQSAVASLAINAVNIIFAATYTMLAQRRSLLVSLGGAYIVWLTLAVITNTQHWSIGAALVLNVLVLAGGIWLVRPLRHVSMMRVERRWYDYALRAGLVATLVGILVAFSSRVGPYASGLLAVFPVILTSIILILHNRAGGKPTAAVMANAVLGLTGFGIACIALHYSAALFGKWPGLALALAVSVAFSVSVWQARRLGLRV